MKFNEKLLDLRKQKGWSQEELGDKLNVSRQTISKWEIGATTPELENLIMLSEIFDISIDELVDNSRVKADIKEDNIETKPKAANSDTSKAKKTKLWFIIIIIFLLVGICGTVYYRANIIRESNIRKYEVVFGAIYSFDGCLDIQTYEIKNNITTRKRIKIFKYNETQELENGEFIKYKIQEIIDEKLVKETFFDIEELNFNSNGKCICDDVVEIDYENNTYKILNGYEFDFYFTGIINTVFDSMFNVESIGGVYEALKLENQILEDDRFYYIGNKSINSVLRKDYVTLKIDKENNWLRLVSKEYDENQKANTKETIYVLTGIVNEEDVKLPDLSQFTLVENQ